MKFNALLTTTCHKKQENKHIKTIISDIFGKNNWLDL